MKLQNAYVIGAGMVPFGRHKETPLSELAARAISAAMQDAGLEGDEIMSNVRPQLLAR
jgi:acetyl-CoA acetyltransferase